MTTPLRRRFRLLIAGIAAVAILSLWWSRVPKTDSRLIGAWRDIDNPQYVHAFHSDGSYTVDRGGQNALDSRMLWYVDQNELILDFDYPPLRSLQRQWERLLWTYTQDSPWPDFRQSLGAIVSASPTEVTLASQTGRFVLRRVERDAN